MYGVDGTMVWLAWPLIAGLSLFLQVRRRAGLWHTLGVLLLATYALWIVSVALFPMYVGNSGWSPDEAWLRWRAGVNLVPFRSLIDSFGNPDALHLLRMHGGNFLLLAPFTLLGPVLWPRLRSWWKALLLGLGASLGIELAQWGIRAFTEPPFRSIDIDDVILNTAGAMFGYGLFAVGRRWARPSTSSG